MTRILSFHIILSFLLLSFSWTTSADLVRTARRSNNHILDKAGDKGIKALGKEGLGNLSMGGNSMGKGKSTSSSNSSSSDSTPNSGRNSTSVENSSTSTSSSDASTRTSDSTSTATATSSAATIAKDRDCDQGDLSLSSGLETNTVVLLGMQAAVQTLLDLVSNGNSTSADISDATTRLQQFMNTTTLQIQMATGIADDDSLAQPQLTELQSALNDQAELFNTLTGTNSDIDSLNKLADSAKTATGLSQDGSNNAIVDCNLSLTVISG